MDEINDFFDFSKDFERVPMPRGAISGNVESTTSSTSYSSKPIKREWLGNEYADEVADDERKRMMSMPRVDPNETAGAASEQGMDDVEDLSSGNEMDEEEPVFRTDDSGVYDKYVFDLNREETLPIHDAKENIITLMQQNSVIVLEGDTGCGKTTQVPQYILDDHYVRRQYCNIVCTQPRRIAAISIARRVCSERKWEPGTVVGHQVGLHANYTEDTRILYCTTGVLLQRLIREKSLNRFTHIILDEVHERDQEMDFLLIVIRRLMLTNSRNVKVILMSATIDTEEFAEYFKISGKPAPVLHLDTRRLYNVREFYLCDLARINNTDVQVDFNDPGISLEMYNVALKLVIVIDNIEKQEMSSEAGVADSTSQASILIFLPGINEIDQMNKRLHQLNETKNNNVKLYPIRLHSLISPDEQVKIFHRVDPGFRKVILATNIAESSITVPDVKYVVDFCLTKALVTDTTTNFTSLQLQWAAQANCRQRSGRAGRVMNGRVYRLVSRHFYDNFMFEFGTPEMLRCPLENVVLKAKLLDMGPPPNILGLAMSPPNLSDITNTILTLKEVGALYTNVNGVYSIQDGDLSFLGRVMASLPLDIRLSRLIMLGWIFSALEDSIIIAAGLSVRSIFRYHNERKQNEAAAYIQKLTWADGSGSDLFAMLKAYWVWVSMREQNNVREDEGEESWAARFYLNLRSIKEMHLLVIEIKERLMSLGIKDHNAYQRVHWVDREKSTVLKIIIGGAFYPNYFTRSNLNNMQLEREVYHTLCGNDPCTTVYFTNFNRRHIGQLYVKSIKDLFRDVLINPDNIEVRFPDGAERVFVTFKSDPDEDCDDGRRRLVVPGHIRAEVYKAVRMRMLNMHSTIRVMDPRAEVKYAESMGVGKMHQGAWQTTKKQIRHPELICLPSVFAKNISGYITHVDHCSKFFFQPLNEMERLGEMHSMLNHPDYMDRYRFRHPSDISKGMILSAPYEHRYQRAKVMQVIHATRQHLQFKVYFIDYGNTEVINFDMLRSFPRSNALLTEIPPRCFECRLAMVQPSLVKSPNGKWCDEAVEFLNEMVTTEVKEMEVYSIVGNVCSVIIKIGSCTLNDILVDKGFARSSDENYMSKYDHDIRLRKQSVAPRFIDDALHRQNEEYLISTQNDVDVEVDPPPRDVCTKTIKLRGPYSPLETRIFSAFRIGAWRSVQVERESVNSVLLDTDPQDVHERLIVAASITETQNGDTLTTRSTTLMPNIHGFSALMTLLFCPTMQIKRNKDKTKYVSILAGLGYNESTYEPLYSEHDIVMTLDADILTDDLELINQLRYCMDTMLFTNPGDERPATLPHDRANVAAKIKTLIIRLLSKNRKYIESHLSSTDGEWQEYDPADVVATPSVYGRRSLFPMHSAMRLYDEKFDRMHALGVHCQELHRLRQFDGAIQPITCLLCNQPLEGIVQLRIHLLSQMHRDREQRINFQYRR